MRASEDPTKVREDLLDASTYGMQTPSSYGRIKQFYLFLHQQVIIPEEEKSPSRASSTSTSTTATTATSNLPKPAQDKASSTTTTTTTTHTTSSSTAPATSSIRSTKPSPYYGKPVRELLRRAEEEAWILAIVRQRLGETAAVDTTATPGTDTVGDAAMLESDGTRTGLWDVAVVATMTKLLTDQQEAFRSRSTAPTVGSPTSSKQPEATASDLLLFPTEEMT